MRNKLGAVLAVCVLVALPILMASCSDSAEPTPAPTATPKPPVFPTASPTPVPSPTSAAPPAAGTSASERVLGSLAGIQAVGALDLHDLEESLEGAQPAAEMSPQAAGSIKNVLAAIAAIPWPQDLANENASISDALIELRGALVAADLAKARSDVEEAHEAWEDLSAATYGWLDQQVGESGIGANAVLGSLAGVQVVGGLDLHHLEESLEEAQAATEIRPQSAGDIKNALAVIAAIPWSEGLANEVASLRKSLTELRGALVAADLAKALSVVEEAHEAWEDLSAATYDWLGQQERRSGTGATAVLASLAGVHAVRALDLHDLEESLEEVQPPAAEIGPQAAGSIKNALAAIAAIPWPQDLAKEVTTVQDALTELQGALVAADLTKARAAVEEAHEAWEDLSTATYEWLDQQEAR